MSLSLGERKTLSYLGCAHQIIFQQPTSEKSDSLRLKLSGRVFMGLFGSTPCVMTRQASCLCLCAKITSGTPLVWHSIEYQRQDVSSENMFRNASLKLNSDSTPVCILLFFLEAKSPRHIFLQLLIVMIFFSQFHLPLCYFELF